MGDIKILLPTSGEVNEIYGIEFEAKNNSDF